MMRLSISALGLRLPIWHDDQQSLRYHETLIDAACARCRPRDTLADLKHRAVFSKEDQGLLRDWMAVAAERASERARARQRTRARQADTCDMAMSNFAPSPQKAPVAEAGHCRQRKTS